MEADPGSTTAKRRSEEAEEGAAKRARMEDAEMTRRIKKYLEENRSQKFIDIERMALSLHTTYPDYGRRKQAVLKAQVFHKKNRFFETLIISPSFPITFNFYRWTRPSRSLRPLLARLGRRGVRERCREVKGRCRVVRGRELMLRGRE